MTVDEVIVFKVFEYSKGSPLSAHSATCPLVFHPAFDDPSMLKTSERRNSCEFRPWVFHKKKAAI